jgi:DNA-binding response OmpR family regulator
MRERPVVLALDRNRRNLELLEQFLGQEGFGTRAVASIEELDRALEEADTFSVALLDLAGFDRSIWKRCERLQEAGIPFLVISPRQSMQLHQDGLSRGAKAVLVKPLGAKDLLALIRSLLDDHTQADG